MSPSKWHPSRTFRCYRLNIPPQLYFYFIFFLHFPENYGNRGQEKGISFIAYISALPNYWKEKGFPKKIYIKLRYFMEAVSKIEKPWRNFIEQLSFLKGFYEPVLLRAWETLQKTFRFLAQRAPFWRGGQVWPLAFSSKPFLTESLQPVLGKPWEIFVWLWHSILSSMYINCFYNYYTSSWL